MLCETLSVTTRVLLPGPFLRRETDRADSLCVARSTKKSRDIFLRLVEKRDCGTCCLPTSVCRSFDTVPSATIIRFGIRVDAPFTIYLHGGQSPKPDLAVYPPQAQSLHACVLNRR